MVVIKDIIHGDIEIKEEEEKVLDSHFFQRLRHISQNSMAYMLYPSLTHTRFSHSLGVMHIASKIFISAFSNLTSMKQAKFEKAIKNDCKELNIEIPKKESPFNFMLKVLRLTALLHDIGHFPFSHATEEAFRQILELELGWIQGLIFGKSKVHETMSFLIAAETDIIPLPYKKGVLTTFLALNLDEEVILKNREIIEQVLGEETFNYLLKVKNSVFETVASIISSPFDADRIDYMMRDGRLSGTTFGSFDLDRILDSVILVKSLGWGMRNKYKWGVYQLTKARSALESFVFERTKLYRYVYMHRIAILYNKMLEEIVTSDLGNLIKEKLKPFKRKLEDDYEEKVKADLKEFFENPEPQNLLIAKPFVFTSIGSYSINPEFFIKLENETFSPLDDIWLMYQVRNHAVHKTADIMERKFVFLWKYKDDFEKFWEKIFYENFFDRLEKGTGYALVEQPKAGDFFIAYILGLPLITDIVNKVLENLTEAINKKLKEKHKNASLLILSTKPDSFLFDKKVKVAFPKEKEISLREITSPILSTMPDEKKWLENDIFVWFVVTGVEKNKKEQIKKEVKKWIKDFFFKATKSKTEDIKFTKLDLLKIFMQIEKWKRSQ